MMILLEAVIRIGFFILSMTFFWGSSRHAKKSDIESQRLSISSALLGFLSFFPVIGGWYGLIPAILLLIVSLFGLFARTKEARISSLLVGALSILNVFVVFVVYG